ncbi:MAG: argininosuccinate lyase [Deltaproteobacteria bacterium]|nr:argininosuccinate lyase [Deltaproteobacteria bacterium]MBW2414613.1 argininosuccinate lyase [Deltaproteobacteria bacterium]
MADEKTSKPWAGRFQKAADPALESFSSSVHFDRRLWRQDLRGSVAHARMLAKQGILDESEAETLVRGLERVGRELADGTLELDPAAEDIHMNVERRLYTLVGDVAGKLHSGRSRNDQVATDLALWMRDEIPRLRRVLLDLRSVLVERATGEVDVILPGYTHLQRAQPVRLAHHWLAHFEALSRDDSRLRDARARISHSPLGAGALAGTTLPLDRDATALELGFEAPARNSLDAISSRDAALELLSNTAILMIHLSRICEELVLWNSSEFGFVEMDDSFSTGSSLMPQKKNPDVAELVRGKSGRVVGDLVSLLVTMKGLPLAYNRDMQEDKEPLFDAVETACACLEVLSGTIRTLRVNRQAMAAAAADPMLLATDLAEHLVEARVPFREAHEVVGRIVAHALDAGAPLSALSRDTLTGFHPALDIDPATFFSAERSLEARSLVGGPARKAVDAALREAQRLIETTREELGATGDPA